tara:strand:- start:12664 stop:14112 length:1449 start_codon:yes stop_codon:yes gene_type:complete
MPITDSYSGRSELLTAEESDRLNNPGKYDYDQETYDQLVAVLLPKIASRRAADRASREIMATSYAAFGPTVPGGAGMSTKPLFSLAGRSGQTSGGFGASSSSLEYAEGGVVAPQGIEALPESNDIPSDVDPILEHYSNDEDGTVPTVSTTQVELNGVPTLIPTVWDGETLSEGDAVLRAIESGKKWPTAETHEDLRQIGNALASDFRQSRAPRGNFGNMGFDGRNVTGSGSVSFPVKGNPLTLGASGYAGADGAGITELGASYQIPDKNIGMHGSYRPENKSWQANFVKRFEGGGMVEPVQYMKQGGIASSPYGTSLTGVKVGREFDSYNRVSAQPARSIQAPTTVSAHSTTSLLAPSGQRGGDQKGVGGLFQRLPQMGMLQAQMGGAPLEVYGTYLNSTYTEPAQEASQEKVTEFIDLVDQAERAHFGAEESFGYGGGAYQQGLFDQYQQDMPPPISNGTQGFAPQGAVPPAPFDKRFRVY